MLSAAAHYEDTYYVKRHEACLKRCSHSFLWRRYKLHGFFNNFGGGGIFFKTKTMRGATVPKPFNLSRGTKRKVEETSTYVPMAQLIQQFQRRTPERYHLRSRKTQDKGMCFYDYWFILLFSFSSCNKNTAYCGLSGPSPVKGDHLKLTQPHTPHFVTKQRSRPPTVKSQAELDAEELNRIKK